MPVSRPARVACLGPCRRNFRDQDRRRRGAAAGVQRHDRSAGRAQAVDAADPVSGSSTKALWSAPNRTRADWMQWPTAAGMRPGPPATRAMGSTPMERAGAAKGSIRSEWFGGMRFVSIITESRALYDPRIHRSSALQCFHQNATRGSLSVSAKTAGSSEERDGPTPLHGTGSGRIRCVVRNRNGGACFKNRMSHSHKRSWP